ncbi:MAG: hypothetical protein CME20_09365 [Gemmatimonadetes bacterium]|jgi:acetylornithine deacetylase/succinyl-diaminopimelate desuccinylase-like protein|nr:hypothetical protein [Gemmatimonadota bacterium]
MDINWKNEGAEAVERLRGMIRFDTVNPPGNERALVEWLAAELRAEGLAPEVIVSEGERANLAVRLKGDGSERPLLLMSHLDVVPVEQDRWSCPPFAAEVQDGFVYGRGAIDSKLTGAVQLQVLLLCHRLGLGLKRDLVLVAAADEERGGVYGMEWLARERPELFDAEFGLNEGGGFALVVDGVPLYTVQVGEKGGADVDLVANGQPGHSSVPHDDNAVFHLAQVLARMAGGKMPHQPPASVRAFFAAAAAAMPRVEVAADLRALLDPAAHATALARLPVNEPTRRMFDAMVRNTCAPTILQAGLKRNVIPSAAVAQLSGRPLPDVDAETFVGQVQALAGEGVDCQLETFRPGVEFDHRSPLFAAVAAAVKRFDPVGVAVPYMQTGGTDARFLTDRDIAVYGFVPMRHEEGLDFFELCHGHDERVSVDNILCGVQAIFDIACRLNGVGDYG